MENTHPGRQQEIEARAAQLVGLAPGPGQTVRDLYGEMADWTFQLGPWQFLLDPVSQRWFVRDFAHDQYVDTGYRAGEIVFGVEDAAGPPTYIPR